MTEVTSKELLAEVQVSAMMLSKWGGEGLYEAARLDIGLWDREAALQWIADRREDSLAGDGSGTSRGDLTAARVRLYQLQGDGVAARNALLTASTVFRDSAVLAYGEAVQACVGVIERWVRAGATASEIAARQEAANDLRRQLAESTRSVARALERGEDLGSARTRLPRRVGG